MVAIEELFGEAFTGFQPRCGFRRTENLPAPPGELIDYAQGQRQFRSDHGKVRMNLGGQRDQRIDAVDINRKALGLIGNAAVSRRPSAFRLMRSEEHTSELQSPMYLV